MCKPIPKAIVAAGLLGLLTIGPVRAQDPRRIQEEAIQRFDEYKERVRKSGDLKPDLEPIRQVEEALAFSTRALLERGDLAEAAIGMLKRANAQRLLQKPEAALESYRHAEEAARRAKVPSYQARSLTGQAQMEKVLLRHEAAKAHAQEAIRMAADLAATTELFDALTTAAGIEAARQDFLTAMALIERAFTLVSSHKEPSQASQAYHERANILFEMARRCDPQRAADPCIVHLDLSASDLKRAMELERSAGEEMLARMTEGQLLILVGMRLRLLEQAQSTQRRRSPVMESPSASDRVFTSEHFVAGPAPEHLLPMLEAEHRRFVEERKQLDIRDLESDTLYSEGMLRQFRGDQDGALAAHQQAALALERERGQLRDEQGRALFMQDKMQIYEALIRHLLQRRRYAEAFLWLERSRTRGLADLLTTRELVLRHPGEQRLQGKLVHLRSQIAALQRQIFARMTTGSDREASSLSGQLRDLEGQQDRLLRAISQRTPRLRELLIAEPPTLEQLQRTLREDGSELLQYQVTSSDLILWHIGPNEVQARVVYLDRSALIEKIKRLRESIANPRAAFDARAARDLFLFLIQPAQAWLNASHLVIIPDQDLHYLPFQALLDPVAGGHLGERYQISYVPNASVMVRLPRSSSLRGGRLLAAADPEIGAAPAEVTAIAALYPGRGKSITQALIREADLKAWARGHDVLHLSVHGLFNARDPLLSHVKLRPGEGEDGQLTAAEMFGLPLEGTRLVVLSACETGRAEATRGGEILGMVRALLYAGAGSLVLSSWEVDDVSTALWMEIFHREAQAVPLSQAAYRALRALKAHPEFSQPRHWAAFNLIGR